MNKFEKLIASNESEPLSKKTVKDVIRNILEPVIELGEESLVLHKISDTTEIKGVLTRIDSCSFIKKVDFNNISLLKSDIWAYYNFITILAPRYTCAFIYRIDQEYRPFYFVVNSKIMNDVFEAISENSKITFKDWLEKLRPDRRENEALNSSFIKLIASLGNSNREYEIKEIEKRSIENNSKEALKEKFNAKKIKEISHEIRNQLSILDIYSKIIEKKTNLTKEAKSLRKSISLIDSKLMSLKQPLSPELDIKELNETVLSAVNFFEDVDFIQNETISAYLDENLFISILVNLIKNAKEAGGKVKIELLKHNDETAKLRIENNGEKIEEDVQAEIFEEGFTTKKEGSGLGLYLVRKQLEEMFCKICLLKSDEESTVFEITLPTIN